MGLLDLMMSRAPTVLLAETALRRSVPHQSEANPHCEWMVSLPFQLDYGIQASFHFLTRKCFQEIKEIKYRKEVGSFRLPY